MGVGLLSPAVATEGTAKDGSPQATAAEKASGKPDAPLALVNALPKKQTASGASHIKSKDAPKSNDAVRPKTPASVLHEVAAYARLARQAADQEKWPLTEHFLEKMVDLPASDDEKKSALLEIAKTYELYENYPKAIAMYERINTLFANDSDHADRLLALGQLYRRIGANELAIARFYNVLNACLTLNNRRLESSRILALRAQTEIADTQFLIGNYPQARRYYELLSRLDLSGDERARVNFRLAHSLYLMGEVTQSGAATQQFLQDYPDDPATPECRYILALSLRALSRPTEAYEQILALVKEQDARKSRAPDQWLFWQKKAGNEFANDLYQHGEFVEALTIYQNLATLSESPDWQWPVVYQMALCFEKLRLERRAAEAYKLIVDESKRPGRDLSKMPDNLRTIVEMAQWRGEQLVWKNGTAARLDHLLGPDSDAQAVAHKSVSFR